MFQKKDFNNLGFGEQKSKNLTKEKLNNKKVKVESSNNKEINKFLKKLISKRLTKINTFSKKKNNITINNNINNIINNIMINTSDKRRMFRTSNNSQSRFKEELDRPFKYKNNITVNFLSIMKKKNISRNKDFNPSNLTNNNSLNLLTFNNRIWKQTSFIQKRNKKRQRNFQKINSSINSKFNLTSNNKSILNSSINVSINESSKKYKIIPFNTHNNFDNSMRNKLLGFSKNNFIKREKEYKMKKTFNGKTFIKKYDPHSIKLNNRYNTKKSISKENSKNKPKNINNVSSKNNCKAIINNKNNYKKDKINQNVQILSRKNIQNSFVLNNRKINANYKKVNEDMKKKINKLNINIINKKISNKYQRNNDLKLNINNNTVTIINERKNKIYGKEKNDSILIQKKSEKLESKNSSLDNTVKFSKSSSKIEDEGELGLDEVKDIIIYYKLNGETQKNYLFTKKDYIDFIKEGKNKYLNFFFT